MVFPADQPAGRNSEQAFAAGSCGAHELPASSVVVSEFEVGVPIPAINDRGTARRRKRRVTRRLSREPVRVV